MKEKKVNKETQEAMERIKKSYQNVSEAEKREMEATKERLVQAYMQGLTKNVK